MSEHGVEAERDAEEVAMLKRELAWYSKRLDKREAAWAKRLAERDAEWAAELRRLYEAYPRFPKCVCTACQVERLVRSMLGEGS